MNSRYIAAARKAEQIRMKLSLNSFEPLNIFDVCQKLDVTVRFVDINMEGMYVSQSSGKSPTIILSKQRPLVRRVFTCAHELGHHVFEHGSRMDALAEHVPGTDSYSNEELLVDTFAGALLMPIGGVQAEFNRRNWKMEIASQLDFYVISNYFGVGYQTLVSHCRVNNLISTFKSESLLKTSPKKLFNSIDNLALPPASFKVIDGKSAVKAIDLEVSNYIFLPKDSVVEGNHLSHIGESSLGGVYLAKKPGVVRVRSAANDLGCFIRIQNSNYIGLAENRHLENN